MPDSHIVYVLFFVFFQKLVGLKGTHCAAVPGASREGGGEAFEATTASGHSHSALPTKWVPTKN